MAPTFGHGKIAYLEIPTADVARSVSFYKAVFGWPIKLREDRATAFDDGVGEVSGTWVTGRPPADPDGNVLGLAEQSAQTGG